jgi:hypothetical protein
MRFFPIFENHGYTPTPGLGLFRPAVGTPNNLPDNRRGGLFLPLITTQQPNDWETRHSVSSRSIALH